MAKLLTVRQQIQVISLHHIILIHNLSFILMHEWQYITYLIPMNNFTDITFLESCMMKTNILRIINWKGFHVYILYHADWYFVFLPLLLDLQHSMLLILLCNEPLVVWLVINTNHTMLGSHADFCAIFDSAHNQPISLNHYFWIGGIKNIIFCTLLRICSKPPTQERIVLSPMRRWTVLNQLNACTCT